MGLVDYGDSDDENISLPDEDLENKDENVEKKTDKDSFKVPEVPQLKKPIRYADKVENVLKMRVPKGVSKFSSSLLDKKSLFSIPSIYELDSSDDSDEERKKKTPKRKILAGDARNLLDILPKTVADQEIYKPNLIPKQAKKPEVKEPVLEKEKISSIKLAKEDLISTENIHLDEDQFFSFYDAEKESDELSKIAPAGPLITKPLIRQNTESHRPKQPQIIGPQITDPSSIEAQYLTQDPSYDAMKPGQRILNTHIPEMVDGYNIEGFWNEESLIPGPEKKRAKRARETALLVNKGMKSLIENLPTREIDQKELTKGFETELMKSITSDRVQYYEAPKQHAPSHQASRKNQITSLAFNAQENEMDLKDRWASAKTNLQARRNKYGF